MSRGFTLIELLVAVLVGSIAIMAAATLATWGLKSSNRAEESNALGGRTGVVASQLRADLGVAGFGATGAIAVPCGNAPWAGLGAFCIPSQVNGTTSVPAVRGADGPVNPNILPETDVIQLVVPNPGGVVTVVDTAARFATTVNAPPLPDPTCGLVYISDHSSPNGSGRTQITRITPGSGNPIVLLEPMMFTLAPGSDVTCVRISVYWVDNQKMLRRSDLDPAAPGFQVGGTGIWISAAPNGQDFLTPGIEDFQIAYNLSSMVAGSSPAARWAFDQAGALDVELTTNTFNWFEVRSVRFSVLMRSLRRVADSTTSFAHPVLENRQTPVRVPIGYRSSLVQSGAELTNLRFFDQNAETTLAAEPF